MKQASTTYIDGFVHPIPQQYLATYQQVATAVADIWKEHGALAYFEYVGDDMMLEGTRSFTEALQLQGDEVVLFGWIVFPSRSARDLANQKVAADPRMEKLIAPLIGSSRVIFDASRMLYGGFSPLVQQA